MVSVAPAPKVTLSCTIEVNGQISAGRECSAARARHCPDCFEPEVMFSMPLLATAMWVEPLVNGSPAPPTFRVVLPAIANEAELYSRGNAAPYSR